MPLVPALCTQCGAQLNIDSDKEAAICPYCKTPFITEKAINNYNTTNVTNIASLHADVLNISNGRSVDDKVRAGDTFLKMKDYHSAENTFVELTREYPFEFRGWIGLIRVKSEEFKKYDLNRRELANIAELYRKACTVATDEEKSKMNSLYLPYYNSIRSQLDQAKSKTEMEVARVTEDYMRVKTNLENRIEYLSAQIQNAKRPSEEIRKYIKIAVWVIAIFVCVVHSLSSAVATWIMCYIIGRIAGGILGSIADTRHDTNIRKKIQESSELKNNLRNIEDQYDNDLDKYAAILERVGDKI